VDWTRCLRMGFLADVSDWSDGDKARVALMVSAGLAIVLAFAAFVLGLVLNAQGNVDRKLVAMTSPFGIALALVALLVMQMAVSGSGIFASVKRRRGPMVLFFILQIVLVLCIISLFLAVLLLGNGATSGGTLDLTDPQERRLTLFAIEEPDLWLAFQNKLRDGRDCCGLRARSIYNSSDGGFDDLPVFQLEDVFSGDACEGSAIDEARLFKQLYSDFNETADAAQGDTLPFNRESLICYDEAVSILRDAAASGGILLGVLIFFISISLGMAAILLFSIGEDDGGMKEEASFISTEIKAREALEKEAKKKKKANKTPTQVVIKFDKR